MKCLHGPLVVYDFNLKNNAETYFEEFSICSVASLLTVNFGFFVWIYASIEVHEYNI